MASELVDNTHKTPRAETDNVANHVAGPRFIFNSSTKKATITSKTEIVEVSAATPKRIKNMIEKIVPPVICSKIFGKVINASPGPDSGAILNAKTAGKIAIPAKTATKVSAITTDNAVEARLSFF